MDVKDTPVDQGSITTKAPLGSRRRSWCVARRTERTRLALRSQRHRRFGIRATTSMRNAICHAWHQRHLGVLFALFINELNPTERATNMCEQIVVGTLIADAESACHVGQFA